MLRYYFMIRFIPKEANLELLTGRCISILHGFISRYSVQGLGLSFPAWSDSSIGNVIAFVHSEATILEELKQQGYFINMQDNGFFKVDNVELVPDDCVEVRFKRNQGIAKLFVGEARRRLKRLEKRALARGDVFEPNKTEQVKVFDTFQRVAISSGSNGQDFVLHIQKELVQSRAEPNFISYGLATSKLFKGSVPDLSSLILT